jgi:hypothetical protein
MSKVSELKKIMPESLGYIRRKGSGCIKFQKWHTESFCGHEGQRIQENLKNMGRRNEGRKGVMEFPDFLH